MAEGKDPDAEYHYAAGELLSCHLGNQVRLFDLSSNRVRLHQALVLGICGLDFLPVHPHVMYEAAFEPGANLRWEQFVPTLANSGRAPLAHLPHAIDVRPGNRFLAKSKRRIL